MTAIANKWQNNFTVLSAVKNGCIDRVGQAKVVPRAGCENTPRFFQQSCNTKYEMAFLKFPVYFSDDEDNERRENLGLSPDVQEGEITINTHMICAYNEMDNGCTMARLANGDCVEIPLDLETFEEILEETELIVNLPKINSN